MKIASKSDIGRVRDKDEDSILAMTVSSAYKSKTYEKHLLILGDGVGGLPSGELASYLATKYLSSYLLPELLTEKTVDYSSSLHAGIKDANRGILEYALRNPEHAGMCTTLVAAVISEEKLFVGSVGDSRLYVLSGDDMKQVTVDHRDVEPDSFKAKLRSGDVILLCCDGLTDQLKEEEIRKIISKSRSLDAACSALVGEANGRGGVDNVSLILAEVGG
jgi:protein phosphatase